MFIPLIAMQFTNEVNWDLADFVVMVFLLLAPGWDWYLFFLNIKRIKNKIVLCGIILAMLLIIYRIMLGIQLFYNSMKQKGYDLL